MDDLQSRCELVVELEISIEENKKSIRSRKVIETRKIELLEDNLEKLTSVQQITDQNSLLKSSVRESLCGHSGEGGRCTVTWAVFVVTLFCDSVICVECNGGRNDGCTSGGRAWASESWAFLLGEGVGVKGFE